MNYAALAESLRQRLQDKNLLERSFLDEIPDAQIFMSYVTCAHCGQRGIGDLLLSQLVEQAADDEHFLALLRAHDGQHPCRN
jgi:hypothetical protein